MILTGELSELCPFAASFRDAKRVLFQAAGRISLHNLAQLQEAQSTTVIGGEVDQACRAIATAVERAAHRGMLRAGRARGSDPWRAWSEDRICARARVAGKLATLVLVEAQDFPRQHRPAMQQAELPRGGFGVMAPHGAARARQSLGCARCWCREPAQQKP